jgi:hypothetical protein
MSCMKRYTLTCDVPQCWAQLTGLPDEPPSKLRRNKGNGWRIRRTIRRAAGGYDVKDLHDYCPQHAYLGDDY